MLDLAIIGSGPAALAAAIYAARAGLSVEVFEKGKIGGALNEIAKIDNFPGFIGTGDALAKNFRAGATNASAKITFGTCENLTPIFNSSTPEPPTPTLAAQKNPTPHHFRLSVDGEIILARTVLVATGSEPKKLAFTPAAPVSYCALCDGPIYKDKDIAVIGGGNSAVQESLHLAELVRSLTVFSHSPLRAEPYLVSRLKSLKNVKIRDRLEPTPELLAPFAGVFVFIGKRPATSFLEDLASSTPHLLDQNGYLLAEHYETVLPGLFAAGDVRQGSIKQAISAAAEGAAAALKIIDFLKSH